MTALRAFPVLGIRTNIAFLIRVLESDAFTTGQIHTGFLDADGASLATPDTMAPPAFIRAALDLHEQSGSSSVSSVVPSARDPWSGLDGWGQP